ncbi:short-chain dehydrogenase [Trinickia dabaoshanensis]|uniref:Short-chain dehydrogenase n=1 Tax=Trinickia dabaoshanensis TaxID=564714 RepID=A0A2N7VFD3_9BURK|nr:SDR family oxidoreductase [Trinickia dabaoshanensis]PMS15870.1 short-chain dehydrogenase [Trinickia dabaoshanensis]
MRKIEELMSLAGKTAVVTGGAGHIGAAMAEALAEAKATVVLVDRQAEQLTQRAADIRARTGARVETFELELADETAVRALPERVATLCGGLDVLVNCAAFVGTSQLEGWAVPFEQQKTPAWRAAFEVNVTSVFELVQAALPYLKASGKGSVINVASLYGVVGPDWRLYEGTAMGNPAAYGASKGALIQLTNWLATTLAPAVRVNTISPGGVWRNQPEAFAKRYVERTPLQRMAVEEDFKGAALYLASDLSAYVTGQNLVVDGGWCAW